MKQSHQRLVAVTTAILLASSGGGVGLAVADYTAPPSIDTSGSDDTSTSSNVTDGQNMTVVVDGNDTFELQFITGSNNSEFQLENEENGNATVYLNDSLEQVNWNSTDNDAHKNVTWSESNLLDTEHAIDENVTLGARMVNDTTNDSFDIGHATLYAEFGNNSSVQRLTDSDVGDDGIATATDDATEFFGVTIDVLSTDESNIETDSRSVDGDNTEVVVVLDNSSVSDDYDQSIDAAESQWGGLSSTSISDGTPLWRAPSTISSDDAEERVPIFYEEAPDEFDEDDRTYGVYTEDYGGETAVVYHLGDSFEDAEEVDVTADAGVGMLAGLNHELRVDNWDGVGAAIGA